MYLFLYWIARFVLKCNSWIELLFENTYSFARIWWKNHFSLNFVRYDAIVNLGFPVDDNYLFLLPNFLMDWNWMNGIGFEIFK